MIAYAFATGPLSGQTIVLDSQENKVAQGEIVPTLFKLRAEGHAFTVIAGLKAELLCPLSILIPAYEEARQCQTTPA